MPGRGIWREHREAARPDPRLQDPGDGYPEGTPAWQKEGFEILVKRGIINSPDVWKARFNQPIMVGEILAIIGRM